MPVNDPLIGHNLDGYVIEELLGHGGMGRVYRALDKQLNRYAAIKILDVQAHKSKNYEQRFHREAQSIAKLRHDNIVSIYRFNEIDNIFYMAMEYIDGADLRWVLRDYLAEGQLMDYDTILGIVSHISSALDYSHQNGVIHRDVKPPNIMIARDGKAYLTDFGLALDTTEGSVGEIFGSPHYIAPEQAINSADAVPQTDIYALGVILYEMLTGEIPFSEGSIIEIAMAHINDVPPDPREFNPELHETFIPILDKVLAKEAKSRYQTGATLVHDLKNAVRTVEKTQPARVYSTLSKPAERIAQNISPLRLPEIINIKPPTRSKNSRATRVLTAPEMLPLEEKETTLGKTQNKRSPLTTLIILLIIIGLGLGASYYFAPDLFKSIIPIDGNLSATSSASIEGRVTNINDKNKTITVYDMTIGINENNPLWLDVQVGDIISIEGKVTENNNSLQFTSIQTAELNGKAIDTSKQ